MRVELVTNDSDLSADDTANSVPRPRKQRRGTTAMEYLVMASFVLVVLIIGAQQVGLVTGKLMKGNADATDFHKEDDSEDK